MGPDPVKAGPVVVSGIDGGGEGWVGWRTVGGGRLKEVGGRQGRYSPVEQTGQLMLWCVEYGGEGV